MEDYQALEKIGLPPPSWQDDMVGMLRAAGLSHRLAALEMVRRWQRMTDEERNAARAQALEDEG